MKILKSQWLAVINFIGVFIIGLFCDKVYDATIKPEVHPDAAIGWTLIATLFLIGLLLMSQLIMHGEMKNTHVKIDDIFHQFGLSAMFVPDYEYNQEGHSYERTKQFIQSAQKSLIFLDIWAQKGGDYVPKISEAHDSRKDYYDAILEKLHEIEGQRTKHPFLRKIIQFPHLGTGGTLSEDAQACLELDELYRENLAECFKLNGHLNSVCELRIIRPKIHAQFLIIDEKYIVWPILSSHNEKEQLDQTDNKWQLKRHGSIIFTDTKGDFVAKLMEIYSLVANDAHPLTAQILHKRVS